MRATRTATAKALTTLVTADASDIGRTGQAGSALRLGQNLSYPDYTSDTRGAMEAEVASEAHALTVPTP